MLARAAAAAGLLLLLLADVAAGRELLLRGGRVFDAVGTAARGPVDVLVRDGRIAAVGDVAPAADAVVLDAAGTTVLPGLIDAHVHMGPAPGAAFRRDTPEVAHELTRLHLRAYLANGVTTILDPGTPMADVRVVQALVAAGEPAPRYLTTGPLLHAPGGYPGGTHQGPVSTPAEVERRLDELVALGAVGVKMATEQGGFTLPPDDVRDAALAGIRRRHLPLYVHAMSERDASVALDWGAHAIMHAPIGGRPFGDVFVPPPLSDAYVARLRASGAFQLTTFSLLDTWPGGYDVARLDERMVRLTVPELELRTARDPDAARFFAVDAIGWRAPWVPVSLRQWIGSWLWTRETLGDALHRSQREILRLYRAGVPIVAATDAPSPWPDAIFHFHGVQTPREVELLVEGGFTPAEAIVAATRTPARMLGIDAEVGTVEPGKRADLLVVDGDPLADVRALRRVRWTVKDGVARTPAEWMETPR